MIYIIPTDTCFGLACSIVDQEGYKEIYKLKGRDFIKPLAIMVDTYEYLSNFLNLKQIEFLKDYSRPWTILVKNNNKFSELANLDKKLYKQYAFRLTNNETQVKLIREIGPIFLTSANLAGEKEIYTINDIKSFFSKHSDIKILAKKDLEKISPSDIFEFIGDSTKIKYIRKN